MPGPQQTPQQATQPPAQVTSVSTSNASTVVGSSSATANQPSVGSAPANTSGETQQQMNTLSLCKVGAETVQDIVSRTIELFSFLKQLQVNTCHKTLGVMTICTNLLFFSLYYSLFLIMVIIHS